MKVAEDQVVEDDTGFQDEEVRYCEDFQLIFTNLQMPNMSRKSPTVIRCSIE